VTSTTPSNAPPSVELLEPPFPPAVVEEMIKLLAKAIRAHQLYLPNNPMYQRSLELVRTSFTPIWEHIDELALIVTEGEFKWNGVSVHSESSKSESLAWLFYKDGVRELRILQGFETSELEALLGIVQRARTANPEDDDLLSMLWEKDFLNLRYRFVDLGAEPSAPLDSAMQEQPPGTVDREKVEEEVEESKPAAGVVSLDDFDSTLYFLDDREVEYLRGEVKREYDVDMRRNIVSIILDIYEQQVDPKIRAEISELLDSLMLHLLSAGQFSAVAYLLREVAEASKRAKDIKPDQRAKLAQLPDRLSAADALAQLLQSLDESDHLPPMSELVELFEQLRVSALGTVFAWVGRLQNTKLRPMLEAAAERLASSNTGELVKLINSTDANVSLEAIRRAGGLKTPAAVSPLAKVMSQPDASLRQAAVQALSEIGSPGALQVLEKAIDDKDRDVRVTTVRVFGAKSYRPALPRLEASIKSKVLREADLTEKMAVFEAYGALAGDAGIAILDGILNGKGGLFGRRDEPEFRACAAMALGRINTPASTDVLRRSANEKEILVRNAVNRALRGQPA
jgi:HEAT repeat protein